MNVKEWLRTFLKTMRAIYTNASPEPQEPPEKPLKREEIQEKERQEALAVLKRTGQHDIFR